MKNFQNGKNKKLEIPLVWHSRPLADNKIESIYLALPESSSTIFFPVLLVFLSKTPLLLGHWRNRRKCSLGDRTVPLPGQHVPTVSKNLPEPIWLDAIYMTSLENAICLYWFLIRSRKTSTKSKRLWRNTRKARYPTIRYSTSSSITRSTVNLTSFTPQCGAFFMGTRTQNEKQEN